MFVTKWQSFVNGGGVCYNIEAIWYSYGTYMVVEWYKYGINMVQLWQKYRRWMVENGKCLRRKWGVRKLMINC